MRVCVIGGGNIGSVLAGDMAFRGYQVDLLTGKPESWSHEIEVHDLEQQEVHSGRLHRITDSMEILSQADVIFSTVPSNVFCEKIKEMTPFLKKGTYLGIIPGSGGCEFCCREIIEKGCVLFGFQRVHSIARIREYGKAVNVTSRKKEVQIGAIPKNKTKEICKIVEELLGIPAREVSNYLNVTLTPSNPILHTTRLYTMFRDYEEPMVYDKNIQFYAQWTEESSEMLLACDQELQNICKKFPDLDLQQVVSLKKHYEVQDKKQMTEKISHIPAFQNIWSPMKKKETGYVPDKSSRYFQEDFPYGLCIIKAFAVIAQEETPNIDCVLKWYEKFSGEEYFQQEAFTGTSLKKLNLPQNYGLLTVEQVQEFYGQTEKEIDT